MDMLRRLLFARAAASGSTLTEATKTGNPATFTTDVREALKSLVIPFTPVQAGTGDPSPSNVRPITGRTGLKVYHSREDTSHPEEYTVAFPAGAGTVYGGSLNLTTGVLTVDCGIKTIGSLGWEYGASNTRFAVKITDLKKYPSARTTPYVCSVFKTIDDGRDISSVPDNSIYGTSNSQYTYIKCTAYTSADDLKSAYGSEVICYPLAESLSFQLTPMQIKTLVGTNVLWSDTNGTNTVVYLKKG